MGWGSGAGCLRRGDNGESGGGCSGGLVMCGYPEDDGYRRDTASAVVQRLNRCRGVASLKKKEGKKRRGGG